MLTKLFVKADTCYTCRLISVVVLLFQVNHELSLLNRFLQCNYREINEQAGIVESIIKQFQAA